MDTKTNQNNQQAHWERAQEKIELSRALRVKRLQDPAMEVLLTRLKEALEVSENSSIQALTAVLEALPEEEQRKVMQKIIR